MVHACAYLSAHYAAQRLAVYFQAPSGTCQVEVLTLAYVETSQSVDVLHVCRILTYPRKLDNKNGIVKGYVGRNLANQHFAY
jgi:hypothetical protein